MSIRLFKRGAEVFYGGWVYKVDHIILRGYDVYLHLENCKDNPVHSDLVTVEPTVMSLKRTPESIM